MEFLKTARLRKLLVNAVTLTVFGLSGVSGCGEMDLPKYVELGGLRVLAIQVEKSDLSGYAEVSPGDTVVVRPFVSDFGGGTRTLSYVAVACVDPGVGLGAEPTCEGAADAVSAGSGAVTITGTERTGWANSFNVSVPASIHDARSTVAQFNGVNYLVVYTISSSDGAEVRSFKRIVVSESGKATKNMNPILNDILANGVSLSAMPNGEIDISAQYTVGSLESFSIKNSDLSLSPETETLTTTWFISNGSLKAFRTLNGASTTYTPPASIPGGQTPILVGVLRDSRGGASVRLQSL